MSAIGQTHILNEHQKMLLGMLKDLDSLCREHGINYMLFSGTALGAVRHQGFIPWDDDVDVIMLRKDYDTFFDTVAKNFDHDKYYVQREYSAHWPMHFSKLRLNNTTCIEKYHVRDTEMHQGVYVDIFPCDNLADNVFLRKIQFLASKIVIAKALFARGYETDSNVKKCFMQFCRIVPKEPFWKICIRKKDLESKMVHSFLGCGTKYEKNVFPREWFEETVELPFEDSKFPVSAYYDNLLSKLYGDYMTPPDMEVRKCKEHVAILDLHHPYTAHLEEQRTMQIDSYTRSIR